MTNSAIPRYLRGYEGTPMKKLLLALFMLMPLAAHAQSAFPVGYGVPCNTQVASCQFKNKPGYLLEGQVNNWNTSASVTVMLLDTATVPSSGATVAPVKFWGVAAAPGSTEPAGISFSWLPGKLNLGTGILLVCSSTGPTTYTPASTCTFSGSTQ